MKQAENVVASDPFELKSDPFKVRRQLEGIARKTELKSENGATCL